MATFADVVEVIVADSLKNANGLVVLLLECFSLGVQLETEWFAAGDLEVDVLFSFA